MNLHLTLTLQLLELDREFFCLEHSSHPTILCPPASWGSLFGWLLGNYSNIFVCIFNPLTPVPAVTGRAKSHPQFPVPAVTGRKTACEDNHLSYPPWRHLGSPIVLLLLLRTNKAMRMDFLRIFLEDSNVLVFIPKTDKLLLWHLKWKGKIYIDV